MYLAHLYLINMLFILEWDGKFYWEAKAHMNAVRAQNHYTVACNHHLPILLMSTLCSFYTTVIADLRLQKNKPTTLFCYFIFFQF